MEIPKFSKEEIKKIILSVIGLMVLFYCYSTFLLRPLNQARGRMTLATEEAQKKLADGKRAIEQAAKLEKTAHESDERIKMIDALTPAGAPLAWFPPLLKSFFAADQIEIGHVGLSNTTEFKSSELAAYSKTNWVIDIPRVDFLLLGVSIARLENERPSSKITNIHIQAIQDKPEFQTTTLGIAMIVKK